MTLLPGRLAAPDPGWTARADVVVVGSGIAGLSTALGARRAGYRVLLVTKTVLDAGSTRWAQGGIAAALDPADTPAEHARDTLVAGAGLCDPAAVEVLVTEGPARVRELAALGAHFDVGADGVMALTREGGHGRNRIVHAGGDATGAEVERALISAVQTVDLTEAVMSDAGIEIIEGALALDLLRSADGRACGVTLHVIGEGARDGVGAALGRAVVLATGGLGQVYAATTNPSVSTGDGVALALRADAEVIDLEFVQFHPTVMWLGPGASGQQPLISEAVRGEGAVLIDANGERFMVGRHPLADLAPRDVVAKGIITRMRDTGVDHVFLDARGISGFAERFPTIMASCLSRGIDPRTDPIPVVPAAHYASGGVRADLDGRTTVPGLYACGEVACTGVHGANRLASNSLLEGLVFASRIVADLARDLPAAAAAAVSAEPAGLLEASVAADVRATMTDGVGVLRDAEGLAGAGRRLAELADRDGRAHPGVDAWEATNLHTVATMLAAAATERTETRGCHWRSDAPESLERWHGHLVTTLREGRPVLAYEPVKEGV